MKRWGTSQNFFLAFVDEFEKKTIKKLLRGSIKKRNNIHIYKQPSQLVVAIGNCHHTCRRGSVLQWQINAAGYFSVK